MSRFATHRVKSAVRSGPQLTVKHRRLRISRVFFYYVAGRKVKHVLDRWNTVSLYNCVFVAIVNRSKSHFRASLAACSVSRRISKLNFIAFGRDKRQLKGLLYGYFDTN